MDKENNNFDKIAFLKANYETPKQWAESTIKAHSYHEPIKEEYLERLKNCKTWDDVLILSEESKDKLFFFFKSITIFYFSPYENLGYLKIKEHPFDTYFFNVK